jgi:hypothetical protein
MKDIPSMFYSNGGYSSDSSLVESSNYISPDDCTSTYIPQALIMFNAMCDLQRTVDYTGSNVTSSNTMDDLIITELSLAFADSTFDKVHVDPETGERENRHWDLAMKYMLGRYGISKERTDGRMITILPGATSVAGSMLNITLSY